MCASQAEKVDPQALLKNLLKALGDMPTTAAALSSVIASSRC
jgi:hypothetical protein